jgi:alkylated DNA repair protein alkB family protein 8
MAKDMEKIEVTYNQIGQEFSKTRTRNWPEVAKYIKLVKAGDSILDVGCGNGRLILDLNSQVDYTGMDISQVLLDEAKKIHNQYKFIKGDISSDDTWKKTKNKYNWIFCIAVLHHLDSRKTKFVLKNIQNRLNTDGRLVLTVWNLWNIRYWKNHLLSLIKKPMNWRYVEVPFQRQVMRPCYAWIPADFKYMLKRSGLVVEDIYYSDGKGGKTSWFAGKNIVIVAKS